MEWKYESGRNMRRLKDCIRNTLDGHWNSIDVRLCIYVIVFKEVDREKQKIRASNRACKFEEKKS